MFDFFGYYTKQNSQPQELKIDNRKQDLPNLIENDDYTKKYDELYYIHKLNMNKIEENYRKELEQERKILKIILKSFKLINIQIIIMIIPNIILILIIIIITKIIIIMIIVIIMGIIIH